MLSFKQKEKRYLGKTDNMSEFCNENILFCSGCVYFEYLILNEILSIRAYFIVSIILMIIFACIYFKCSKKFFLRQLVYNVKQNRICI